MPLQPVHIPTPAPTDDFLLDEEFDIFDTLPPYSRKPAMGRPLLVCDDSGWEDDDHDDMEPI